jgi:hypothetical protein
MSTHRFHLQRLSCTAPIKTIKKETYPRQLSDAAKDVEKTEAVALSSCSMAFIKMKRNQSSTSLLTQYTKGGMLCTMKETNRITGSFTGTIDALLTQLRDHSTWISLTKIIQTMKNCHMKFGASSCKKTI